uniref:Uncharacterized protein n=1 Tax=Siphoviridae sp. ctrgt10 TaxID=2826479 RepID=A0A8S5M773_9CAUD|nr:MAG TPA: hypothetical protein [Siphoviridae sp. ctrgt10]
MLNSASIRCRVISIINYSAPLIRYLLIPNKRTIF